MSLGELFVELGVVGDTKDLENFDKKIKQAAKNAESLTSKFIKTTQGVANLITAFVTGTIVVNKFTEQLVATNQVLLDLTRTSDIAQGTFQKWNNVGQLLGVKNAAQQLKGLEERLLELRITGQGAGDFAYVGISPTNPENVLEQLRAKVADMSDAQASYILRRLGIDPQMLHLLRMSTDQFNELNQAIEQFGLTPEQTRDIQMMNIQLQVARIKLGYLKDRAILAIMPAFTRFMTALSNIAVMLAKAGKRVGEFVVKWRWLIAGILLAVKRFKPLTNILTKFSALSKLINFSLSEWITKLPIVGKLFTGLGAVINKALLPITAWFLILEDLAVFLNGGDSVIGDIVNWFKSDDFKEITSWTEYFIKVGEFFVNILDKILILLQKITGIPISDWTDKLGLGDVKEQLKNFDYGMDARLLEDTVLPFSPEELERIRNNPEAQKRLEEVLKNNTDLLINNQSRFLTPQGATNIDNSNRTNTITQHVNVHTTETARELNNKLNFVRFAVSKG